MRVGRTGAVGGTPVKSQDSLISVGFLGKHPKYNSYSQFPRFTIWYISYRYRLYNRLCDIDYN